MGTVSEDHVGAQVDAVVGEGAQIAAVLAQIGLGAVGQVGVFRAFGTAMESHHQNVTLRPEGCYDAGDGGRVGVFERIGVVAERADAVTYTVPFDDGTLAVGQAAVEV